MDKHRYVVYYVYLKLALENRLKLKKIHYGIKFRQGNWLQKYIDLNNDMKKKATNNFDKQF